ncbi:hypothetical protein D3C75_1097870 [compost metagenome]
MISCTVSITIELRVSTARPLMNTRLRPKRSASAPAIIRLQPKVSIKALVTQLRAMTLPPKLVAIAGRETAGPVKLIGMINPARQTENRVTQRCGCSDRAGGRVGRRKGVVMIDSSESIVGWIG